MWRFTRPVHVSWVVAVTCVGIFAGVALSPGLPLGYFQSWAWLLAGGSLVLLVAWRNILFMLPLAFFAGLLIGAWRGSVERSVLWQYQPLVGKTVEFQGIVADDVDTDKRGNAVLRLRDIRVGDYGLPGMLWVTTGQKNDLRRSDHVTVKGELSPGFGSFAGSLYDAELVKAERPVPGDLALDVRDNFAGAVRKAVPEPEASLGVGYLVGQRRSLPEELDTALRTAGLMHIVVASGYNLTILVRLVRRLFEKVSKYLSFLLSGGMIAGFIAVTGLSPSMSRAGLVAGLSLLAWYYGRKFHPLVLLPIAVATTVLFNPAYAWGDVGWQLSFAAFAGVMVLAPLLQVFYFGDKKPGIVRQILGETVSAWICTLPILLYAFGYMSNVAIIANLLILPLIPLAMLLTFIAGVSALVVPAVAVVCGAPAAALLGYMTQVAMSVSNLSWAKSEVSVTGWHVALMYVGIIAFCFFMWRKTKYNLRQASLVE